MLLLQAQMGWGRVRARPWPLQDHVAIKTEIVTRPAQGRQPQLILPLHCCRLRVALNLLLHRSAVGQHFARGLGQLMLQATRQARSRRLAPYGALVATRQRRLAPHSLPFWQLGRNRARAFFPLAECGLLKA